MPKGRSGRKCSIMSASVDLAKDWAPPVFPKNEEAKNMLTGKVKSNILMKHLNPREV